MPAEPRAYPRPLPNPEWLGKLTEEILEPELPEKFVGPLQMLLGRAWVIGTVEVGNGVVSNAT